MKRFLPLLLILTTLPAFAATPALEVCTADTGGTPNTSASFTPNNNDLLVVFVAAAATVENPASAGLTSSVGGFTFTQVDAAIHSGATHTLYAYVGNALSTAAAQTVTWDSTADPSTGTVICVYAVDSMSRTGLSAIKQSDNNIGASGTTPTSVFGTAATTTNPTLVAIAGSVNPAGMTPPTNWTEPAGGDTGFATPDHGIEVAHRASGFTGTTITWGSNMSVSWGTIGVELDTSASESTPTFDTLPNVSAETDTTYTVSYDTANATNFFVAAVTADSAACTCNDIEANVCAGEVAYATEAATNAADSIVLTITGDPRPIHDLKACAENVTLDTAVTNLDDEMLDPPTGYQFFTITGAPGVGEFGLFDDASPAAVATDIGMVVTHCDSFSEGPAANAITPAGDTTFVIDADGDISRQNCPRRFYDRSAGANSDATYIAYYVNNQAPVYIGLDDQEGEIDPYLKAKDVDFDHLVTELFSDAESDTMTLAVANNPAGGSVTGGNNWAGPLTACGYYATVNFEATDITGDAGDETVTVTVGDFVPDVLDTDEVSAVAAIEAVCSLVASAGAPVFSASIVLGNVVSTSPTVGELVVPDETVVYFLSLGPSEGGNTKTMRARNGMRIIN